VSTDQLADWEKHRRVNVVDVRRDVFTYLEGHLPGAVYLNPETLRASDGGIPAQLLTPRAYGELFSRLGLGFHEPVVIYSAGETRNIDATFVAWLLASFGHPQVYVLNGGYFKWELEQRPIGQHYPRMGFGHVWKSPSQLRAAYAAQGIMPDQNIIVYCNSTTEASHVHFTLRYLLGYPRVRIYVGSWTEWAERAELPIQTGIGDQRR
jgi:3-mercaptopyruvate sulfurtransferase SseA